jgi:hypothetical protein
MRTSLRLPRNFQISKERLWTEQYIWRRLQQFLWYCQRDNKVNAISADWLFGNWR